MAIQVVVHEGSVAPILCECDTPLDPGAVYTARIRVTEINGQKYFYPVGEFNDDGHMVVTITPYQSTAPG